MELKPLSGSMPLARENSAADLRRAAEGFEEIFLTQMLKAARSASLGDDIMGSSAVEKTRDLFDAEIARSSSRRTGLGIADAVERQFSPFVTSGSKAD